MKLFRTVFKKGNLFSRTEFPGSEKVEVTEGVWNCLRDGLEIDLSLVPWREKEPYLALGIID